MSKSAFTERYEIGDSFCGVIGYAPTKIEANRLLHHYQHTHRDCRVTVTDRMAHPGKGYVWNIKGSIKVR